MTGAAAVVWDDSLTQYNFGAGHPMAPIRLELTWDLIQQLGLLAGDQVQVIAPVQVSDDLLFGSHSRAYVEAVRLASEDPGQGSLRFGLGTDDVPTFAGMHEASLRLVGATVAAAQAVASGTALHAVNFSGGMHHAMATSASGFCVYNDIVVAIRWLLAHGYDRIAYVDVDVHHGDGVQAAFWDDPRVLTVSIHESGQALFPGTGFAPEVGGRGAEGTAVNIALPPGTGDDGWLRAYFAVVPQVVGAFAPQVLVTQQGCDSHAHDPLADLALSIDGQRRTYAELHRLAHEVAEGRWVATGGGGYSWVEVVPRAWAHLVGEVVGHPVDPQTPVPEGWRVAATEQTGLLAPTLMTDGREPVVRLFDDGFDPDNAVDAAILATRMAVFPHLGLVSDPLGW